MTEPQTRREPERGHVGRPPGRRQLGDEGLRLERVVEPVQRPDRGPVEQPLPLAPARDLPLRGDPPLLVHQRRQRDADRGVGEVLEDDEDGPVEDLLELERQLPADDLAGRVGDVGQVQALGGRVEVALLERVDERVEHRVRRPEVGRHVAGLFPLARREVPLPEEQPHPRQVLERLAVEEPAPVRHPVQRELDVLALADRAIGTVHDVRDHDRRDVGRSQDELQRERQPAAVAPVGRDSREVEAGDGLLDLVRVVLGQVHRDQEGPHGRPRRAEPGVDRRGRRRAEVTPGVPPFEVTS